MQMKFALIFLSTLVGIAHQQLQGLKVVPWLSPYSSFISKYHPSYYDEISYFRYSTPRRPAIYGLQNENFHGDLVAADESHDIIDDGSHEEFVDTQSRIKGFKGSHNNNAARFFYANTNNNPFVKTATFTISSTVTTVGSIIICVPANNLKDNPSPTCSGRKRREFDDSEHFQFPIVPSETVKLIPTALPHLQANVVKETREPSTDRQVNSNDLISSKDELIGPVEILNEEKQDHNLRGKRFFGGGAVASTTLTQYLFVGITLTSTVILDSEAANAAACLPAGYVVCA